MVAPARAAASSSPSAKDSLLPLFMGRQESEGRRKAPFFFASLGTVPQLAMGFEGSRRLREPCGRRRYIKILLLQECFHGRHALRIVAFLAIDTCADSNVIPGAIGILATAYAIVI